MNGVIKYDYNKLKQGMEIFDIVNGWYTVSMINKDSHWNCIYVKRYDDNSWHNCFSKCGRNNCGDIGVRIVAMRQKELK